MLTRYPESRSRNLNEIEASFFANASGKSIDLPGGRPRGLFTANAARFGDGALVFADYASPITLGFEASDSIRLHYLTGGVSKIVVDGKPMENTPSGPGCLVTADRPWSAQHANGLHQLTLRIPTATLRRKLDAFLGSHDARLDLRQPSAADPRLVEQLRAAIFRFARDLELAAQPFLPNLVTPSIDDLCLDILTSLDSQALATDRLPAAPSTVQLGRVEQYLVAHYAEPLTVETLAKISGVSARSVFAHFRSKHQCTPQQYLERVRIQMAHLALRLFANNETVESVALQCGFSSTSTFRQAYQKQFGVPPSPKTAHPGRRSTGARQA